jgi:glycosyltransferase involved in cell wall biosynthesis
MNRRRILIVSTGPLCRNPRVLKEADTLGTAGFDVTVLTLMDAERFESYDREILAGAPFRKLAIELRGTGPAARLAALGRRGGTWAGRRLARLGWESPLALGPAWALGRRARALPADLTIVHSELPFCIGTDLLTRGRRVAADFEDWHSRDLLPGAQIGRPVGLLARTEQALMRACSYNSTTSHAMAAALQETYGGNRPLVLTNSFPLPPPPVARDRSTPPAFFWFSQTIGPGRGLEPFLAAWRLTTQPSRLCLLGQVGEDYRNALLASVPPAWRPRLEFLPIVAPDELPGVIARHDVGLALEPSEPANKDLTISNKILQYLGAGLAVVASGTAGQREVLQRALGAGIVVKLGDTAALAAQLDTLLANPRALAAQQAAARRAAVETYCWEQEEPRLVAAVEDALGRAAGPGHA